MGLKGRTKFTIAGAHPQLFTVRDNFIQKGLALVPWSDEPHFCLYGSEVKGVAEDSVVKAVAEMTVVRQYPTVVLSTRHGSLDHRIVVETVADMFPERLMVIRTGCIYGDVPLGDTQFDTSPLYVDDFLEFMQKAVSAFLEDEGSRCFYGPTGAPVKRFSVQGSLKDMCGLDKSVLDDGTYPGQDLERLGWKPSTSLRQGLWRVMNGSIQ